ncbi:hypothetical protein [Massilia phosphatilytica]
MSYLANVYNEKARAFYHKHGVQLIAAAYESHEEPGEVPLMITKHCLRFSFNLCPKQAKGVQGVQGQVRAEPIALVSGDERYTLKFDCVRDARGGRDETRHPEFAAAVRHSVQPARVPPPAAARLTVRRALRAGAPPPTLPPFRRHASPSGAASGGMPLCCAPQKSNAALWQA